MLPGEIPLDEVVFFDIVTSDPTTGAVSDADSAPTFDVLEEDNDTAILAAQTMTPRSGYTGTYRGTFTASVANGFEVGKFYSIVILATVNAVAGKAVCTFRLMAAEAVAGVPKVDADLIEGTDATDVIDARLAAYGVSTYAGGDTSGVTTLLSRIGSAITISSGALTLTAAERTAIANEVEAQIIDDTDSEKVLQAITDKIAAVNPDLSGLTLGAIASAVWANGTRLLTAGTNIVLAKGTGVTGFNDLSAAQVNAEADAALVDVGLTSTVTGRIDAAVSTRLATAGYTTPPTAADMTTAVLTTQMTEAYAADGTAPTLAQCQFLVMQRLTEFSIAGGTITIKKLDGSTTAATLVMNSATVPTSSTRAS